MATYFDTNAGEQNAGQTWSFDRTGDIFRFELRDEDRWSGDGTNSVERTEYSSGKEILNRTLYTMTYKFMVEAGTAVPSTTWWICGQIHDRNDSNESSKSPPFAFEFNGERLRILRRFQTALTSNTNPSAQTIWEDPNAIVRGRWYDHRVELCFDWDLGGTGKVKFWRDGVLLADFTGQIGYNNVRGGYWKIGVYRRDAANTVAVRYDTPQLVVGTATTDTVVVSETSVALTGASVDVVEGSRSNTVFSAFAGRLADGTIDLDTHVFKAVLTNTAPVASNTVLANISQIASTGGYAAVTLTGVTWTETGAGSGIWRFGCNPISFTASGGTIAAHRYLVIYDDTATNDPLVCFIDRVTSPTISSGATETWRFSSGMFTLS